VRAHLPTHPLPTHPRFESVNFLEFVKLLAPFTSRVSVDDKLNFLFTVFDVDGDGALLQGRVSCCWWLNSRFKWQFDWQLL